MEHRAKHRTPKQTLVEERLGKPVADWVDDADKEAGEQIPWVDHAAAIGEAARIRVSHESLRTWYRNERGDTRSVKEAVPT